MGVCESHEEHDPAEALELLTAAPVPLAAYRVSRACGGEATLRVFATHAALDGLRFDITPELAVRATPAGRLELTAWAHDPDRRERHRSTTTLAVEDPAGAAELLVRLGAAPPAPTLQDGPDGRPGASGRG
jgi:hypothetical protein